MVEDIKPSREGSDNDTENKDDEPFYGDKPATDDPSRVDSLIDHNTGGNMAKNNSNNGSPLTRTAHKFLSRGIGLWPSTKKQKIIGGLAVVVLIVGGVGLVNALKSKPAVDPPQIYVEKPKPKTTEPSRLTGVEISPELNKRPVTAIMIENSPDARPQSGLKDAGIVFEAVAEGGITRFNALFMEGQPNYIGPVRSVRPYYIDLFLPFDASIVHAGGSTKGLNKLKSLHVKDIDHGANADAFQRVSSRFAPHNLFTSMKALDQVNKSRGYKSSEFTSWERKKEEPAAKPTATQIGIDLSGFLYNVHYDYNKKSNSYKRSEAGKPHVDERSHKQLEPKVVVVLVLPYSQSGIYSVYKTRGKGTMFVFQDGIVQKGTWKKGFSKDQYEFQDGKGNKLALNPGQTWVTLAASSGAVHYKP